MQIIAKPVSALLELVSRYCPIWYSKGGNKVFLASLESRVAATLYRLLASEIEERATFAERKPLNSDLRALDFEINEVLGEILNELRGNLFDQSIAGPDPVIANSAFGWTASSEDVGKTVSTLKEKGYCKADYQLTPEQCDAIQVVLAKHVFGTRGAAPKYATGQQLFDSAAGLSVRGLTNSGTYWLLDQNAVVGNPLLMALAFDPYIVSVVQGYFGCPPIHVQTNSWISFPSPESELSLDAKMFHQDKDFIKFLKVFIYLSDVGELQGPHSYVEGSHRDELFRLRKSERFSTRLQDFEIEKYYDPSRIRAVTGPRGLVLSETPVVSIKGARYWKGTG